MECDIDLRRNREHLKAIRRGEVSEQDIMDWAADKERQLEQQYHDSKIPAGPNEAKIRTLLLDCLEEHYGRLDNCVVEADAAVQQLREIHAILERSRNVWQP